MRSLILILLLMPLVFAVPAMSAGAAEKIGAMSFIIEWGEPPMRAADSYSFRRSSTGVVGVDIERVARDPITGWEFGDRWTLQGPCAPRLVELLCPPGGAAQLSFRLGSSTCLDLHFGGAESAAIPLSDAPRVLSVVRAHFRRVEEGMGLRFRDGLTKDGACPH